MTLKLMMLSTGAALLMSPMWAQEQEKKTTTTSETTQTATPSQSGTQSQSSTPAQSETQTTTTQSQTATQTQEASGMKTWTGTLFDADCKSATPTEKCDVTSTTRTFGFMSADGKNYKLDSDSNTKVRTALQTHKDQARTAGTPSSSTSGEVRASVTGSMEGETIKVETIQIL